ncbi:MAG: hypothetical protein H7641_03265, partial [Candidatus Heimdallarchaeota archaeon]|nr:hypothetical protein [Candidatus Heimdallarchaeota archaeon]MCK4876582.1 hypothetical protein [Candidatus Heimdallarchaeota archaeon]
MFLSPLQNDTLVIQAATGIYSEDFTTTTYMDGANTNTSGWGTGAIENSKKKPIVIGSISSSLIGNALDVFIDGNYAYVTDDLTGLNVVDISDPSNPFPIGSFDTSGIAYSVQVAGDCVFLADYGGDPFLHKNFLILNITDPSNPSLLGNCSTYLGVDYQAHGLAVDGNLVYVANMAGGLSVINVTDTNNPTQIGMRNTPGTSYDVYVEGDFAYIADGANGLVVVNITDPINPTIAATFSAGISTADSVIVEGNYAYVVDTDNGLVVVDITYPKTPSFAGEYNNNDVTDVDIYGDFLYITDIYDGLLIVNISIPTSPSLISSFPIPGYTQAIFIEGCNAYLACYNGGFQVAKIADISTPTLIGSYDTPGNAVDVFVSGYYAYVADSTSGLQIIDISNPFSPTYAGSYNTPGNVEDVVISGDYAYVADRGSGLQVLEVRKNRVRQFDSPCFTQSDSVFSTTLFTITSATLDAIDTIPASTSITYSLSADGGSNWKIINIGIEHVFTNTGNQLKWKAVLTTSDFLVTPIINNLSIDY